MNNKEVSEQLIKLGLNILNAKKFYAEIAKLILIKDFDEFK